MPITLSFPNYSPQRNHWNWEMINTDFVTTALEMVDTAEIEPASLLCRRSILPLNYRPIEIVLVDPVGNDPTTVWVWARCSNQLS